MKTAIFLLAALFTICPVLPCFAQEAGPIRQSSKFYPPEKVQSPAGTPLSQGIYTVGSEGDFPQLSAAFSRLSTDGVTGPVTLELLDNVYTAPADTFGFCLIGPVPGAGPDSRVTIRPAARKSVIIEGSGYRVMSFINTSYITLEGNDLSRSADLTIHALYNGNFYWNGCVDFINNSDHNIIQNINFISDDYQRLSTGVAIWRAQGIPDTPDSNLIQNNFVQQAGIGIYVSAYGSTNKSMGNIIRNNKIGSDSDSLITWGILIEMNQNSVIENNIVQNIRQNLSCFITFGINSSVGTGNIIRNNVVYNMNSDDFYGSTGILLSGDGINKGNNEMVYNNMIYDIRSASTFSWSRLAGIQLYYQKDPEIYFNSVNLSGGGTNILGSAALYIYSQCTNVTAGNNILINNRDESPYCASSIYDYSLANLTSDHNDLYCAQNQNNCLVRGGDTLYNSLTDWQGSGMDINSISEMPDFIEPFLHIDCTHTTGLRAGALPVTWIPDDFDGDTRNLTSPCIGADEFAITEIKDKTMPPAVFTLNQNYPNPFNPSTKISWYSPESGRQTLKVYDVRGKEIATLVNEVKPTGAYEITWNAANLPSGVYFYQLRSGGFSQTKKMILLR